MQKVLRRSLLARNQAIKRERREREAILKTTKRKIREEQFVLDRSQRGLVNNERRNRREDWTLGPLAPNRLAGRDGGGYGMLSTQAIHAPVVLEADRERYFNFAVDDRVVVVAGREKGKIGKVTSIDEESQTVEVMDINMVDVKIPQFMREAAQSAAPYRATAAPVHIRDVRLVVPLRNNVTGEIKDTVVRHLRGGKPFVEPAYGSETPKHTRYIAGLDVSIPWPKREIPEFKAEAGDTLAVHVHDRSFSPSVLHLPLPDSAVDEIRNKYSKTRTGHTQEYVQQKMKEDAEKQWLRKRRMLLPQQMYWEHQAKQKDAQGKPEVTNETLDVIRKMQAASMGQSSEASDSTVNAAS